MSTLWSEMHGTTNHHLTRVSGQTALGGFVERRSRLARSLTLAAMSLGYAVVQLDVTMVNTALSSIGASLGGGVTELQWVASSYTIAFAALILTAGALGDRIGAKRIFVIGFALFTTASLACALAPTASALIAARALQGVGAAILVPNSLALLNHAYSGEKDRGRAVGVWAAGASLALTAGPLAGGSLIALVGWRSIFLVNLPIGLTGILLTWRYATETTRSLGREIDLAGQAAAIGGLGCLAGAIIEGGALGWSNPLVLACFAIALFLSAFFVLHERRAPQPMLPLCLFRNRRFSVASLIGLLVNVAFYGTIFVLSLYFQQVSGLSPFAAGLAFLPMMGAVLSGEPFGRARKRAHRGTPCHCRRSHARRGQLRCPHRYPAEDELLDDGCAACRHGRWLGTAGSTSHLPASRQRGEDPVGTCGRRSQLDAADGQRLGRGALRILRSSAPAPSCRAPGNR